MPPEIQAEFFCAWWNNEDRAAIVGNDYYRLSKGHLYKNGENIDEFYTFSKDGTVNLASGEWIPREVMMTFMSGAVLAKAHYLEITTDTRYSYTEEDGLVYLWIGGHKDVFPSDLFYEMISEWQKLIYGKEAPNA